MKKLFFIFMFSLLLVFIVTGCDDSEKNLGNDVKPQITQELGKNAAKYKFALYPVKDLHSFEAAKVSIDKLSLKDEPIMSEKDITAYYWKSNVFVINVSLFEKRQYVSLSGEPFVVVANGERIYLGTLWTGVSSMCPPEETAVLCMNSGAAIIDKVKKEGYAVNPQSDEVYLEISAPSIGMDNRNDKRIYNALKDAGILKE